MLKTLDKIRLDASTNPDVEKRSRLGQFMTPATVARFMASLFTQNDLKFCRLLDAGAGIGSLSSAFLEKHKFNRIEIDAYEIDTNLREQLGNIFACYETIN